MFTKLTMFLYRGNMQTRRLVQSQAMMGMSFVLLLSGDKNVIGYREIPLDGGG